MVDRIGTRRGGGALLLLLMLACGCSAGGVRAATRRDAGSGTAVAQQQGAGQQDRPTSTPYTGDLSIFETPGRDKRLQIDRVMKLLHLGPGKTVADIGAGSGWFSVRAARRVGPQGVVYAEDINPAAVKYIAERAAKEHLANIHAVLGEPADPKLAAASVDVVMFLKVYHEIAKPEEFLAHLRPALREGALVAVIDKNGNGSGTDHGLPQRTLEAEMTRAGFTEIAHYDFTRADDEDYFLIFRASAPAPPQTVH